MNRDEVWALRSHALAEARIAEGHWNAFIDLFREADVEEPNRMELLRLGEEFWNRVRDKLA